MSFWKKFISITLVKDILNYLPKAYEKAKSYWVGKNIAVIGPTASGKDAMFARLRNEEISTEHHQTRQPEKLPNFPFIYTLPDGTTINFTFKKCQNVGGEKEHKEFYWKEACHNADIIFYLIDIKKFAEDNISYEQRVSEDLRWIAENISSFSRNKVIHILLNKVDLLIGDLPDKDQKKFLEEELKPSIDKLDEYSKNFLGEYYSRLGGVYPISMSNAFLFKTYFTKVLIDIAAKGVK